MSKKEKRAEKEMQMEREQQAKALQDRLLRQKKEQQQQQQEQALATSAERAADPPGIESSADGPTSAVEPLSKSSEPNITSTVSAPVPAPAASTDVGSSASTSVGKAQSCNTCGGLFYDSKLYRDHFKYVPILYFYLYFVLFKFLIMYLFSC